MNRKTPFADVMHALMSDPAMQTRYLYRLSDMEHEEMLAFQAMWPAFPVGRRSLIAHHLNQIYDDDFMVDFENVFHFFLSDEAAVVRRSGVMGLYGSTNARHVNPLLRLLETDADDEVRAQGAATLGNFVFQSLCGLMPAFVAEKIMPVLLRTLENPLTPIIVRRRALESASYLDDERVFAFITDAYDTGDFLTQLSAVNAMGINGAHRWLPIVLDELESPYEDMRLAAVEAAGKIGDVQALSQLVRLIEEEDQDRAIREAAIEALAAIGGEEAEQILLEMVEDPDLEDLWEMMAEALEEMDWSNVFDDYLMLDFGADDDDDEDAEPWL